MRADPSKDCGFNLAICCGTGDVETRNVPIPQDQLDAKREPKRAWIVRILGQYVRPAVADVYARTQQPVRIVLLTLKRTEGAARCWINRLKIPHKAAVIGAGARVKG